MFLLENRRNIIIVVGGLVLDTEMKFSDGDALLLFPVGFREEVRLST